MYLCQQLTGNETPWNQAAIRPPPPCPAWGPQGPPLRAGVLGLRRKTFSLLSLGRSKSKASKEKTPAWELENGVCRPRSGWVSYGRWGAGGDKQPGPHGNAAIIFRRRENADETVGIWILNVTQQLLSPFSTRGTNLRAAPGDGDLQRPPAPTKNELHRPEAGET